jgi:hypothetical protein
LMFSRFHACSYAIGKVLRGSPPVSGQKLTSAHSPTDSFPNENGPTFAGPQS